jgi:spore coat polysaccharide biosynthesis protein SpsF
MTTVVVVQARVSSTRLPGKVLLPLAGKTLLERQIERIRAASSAFELCVATTTSQEDDPIRELGRRASVRVFDGHPTDLLDRHYRVGVEYRADTVVKIPSDCPLIDPAAIDRVLEHYQAKGGELDFVSNLYPPSWPDGNDVEVMTMDALACAFQNAHRPFEREHTTPFIWERPERFRIGNVAWETGRNLSKSHRFTVDYAQDFAFVSRVYQELCSAQRPVFSLSEILDLLEIQPEIAQINAELSGRSWHAAHVAELTRFRADGAGVSWGLG